MTKGERVQNYIKGFEILYDGGHNVHSLYNVGVFEINVLFKQDSKDDQERKEKTEAFKTAYEFICKKYNLEIPADNLQIDC